MPSPRDPQEPQDPIEDDDVIGAGEDDADEADDEEEDDDILDEDDEDEDDDAAVEEESDDEPVASGASREALTGEVGSEGGSPGDTVRQRRTDGGRGRGSEATTTWEGAATSTHELKDDQGVPVRRAP